VWLLDTTKGSASVKDRLSTMRRLRGIGPCATCASALVFSAMLLIVHGAPAASGTSKLGPTLRLDASPAPLIAGKRVGTYAQAVRAVGRPARLFLVTGTTPVCRASWPTLQLTIDFSATAATSCAAPNLGLWARVRAAGSRWHTIVGLHVGDPAQRLHALYPAARLLDFVAGGPLWQLETGGPLCDGGPPLTLGARVRADRVEALLVVHVPACG
jgi:hypothetical protein